MADVKIEKDEIVAYLEEYLDLPGLKQAITGLRGIDWNPFDDDGDEYVTVWQEVRHNYDLVTDAAVAVVKVLERVVVGGVGLRSEMKHDAAVAALDRAIRLPFYAEPFDGPALSMLVNMAVKFMNKVDWGVDDGEDTSPIEISGSDDVANPGLV